MTLMRLVHSGDLPPVQVASAWATQACGAPLSSEGQICRGPTWAHGLRASVAVGSPAAQGGGPRWEPHLQPAARAPSVCSQQTSARPLTSTALFMGTRYTWEPGRGLGGA